MGELTFYNQLIGGSKLAARKRDARSLGKPARDAVRLTQRVYNIVLQKSIPTQIRQVILHISNSQNKLTIFGGG